MFSTIAHSIFGGIWSRLTQHDFTGTNPVANAPHISKPEIEVRKVFVLRLGHRIDRDNRATTHVFLTARALGGFGVFYSGQRDESLERRMQEIVNTWGGSFEVRYEKNWKNTVRDWKKKGVICHLTMYGINIDDCLGKIPKNRDILVVV